MNKEEVLSRLQEEISNGSGDGLSVLQSYAMDVDSIDIFQEFLGNSTDIKDAVQSWAEERLAQLPKSENEPFGSKFGHIMKKQLINYGVYVNRWSEAMSLRAMDDVLLALEQNIDVNKIFNKNLFKNRRRHIKALEILHKRGYDLLTEFSIYDCQDASTLDFLERIGCDIEAQIKHGTDEWLSLLTRDESITEYFINSGIDLKLNGVNNKVLHYLNSRFFLSQERNIKLLMDAGADVNVKDSEGNSCFIKHVRSMFRSLLLSCLEFGVNVNACDNDGNFPLLRIPNDDGKRFKLLLKYGASPSNSTEAAQLLNKYIDEDRCKKPIIISGPNDIWIDPYEIHQKKEKPPLYVIDAVFKRAIVTSSREFRLSHSSQKMLRLDVEYFFESLQEEVIIRHLDYFIPTFHNTKDLSLQVQTAFFLYKAAKTELYKAYIESKGVTVQEVKDLLSWYWTRMAFCVKQKIKVYILSHLDLATCTVKEMDADIVQVYIKAHPYAFIYDELKDGYMNPNGIPGYGHEGDYIFLNLSSIKIRQDKSVTLYSGHHDGGVHKFPVEVFEQSVKPCTVIYERCGDGYVVEGINEDNFACLHIETLSALHAYHMFKRTEWQEWRDMNHRRPGYGSGYRDEFDKTCELCRKAIEAKE